MFPKLNLEAVLGYIVLFLHYVTLFTLDPNPSSICKQIRTSREWSKTFKYILFCSQSISLRKNPSSQNFIWIVGWEIVNDHLFQNCLSNLMSKTYFRKFTVFFWFIFYCIVNYKWILNEEWCVSFCYHIFLTHIPRDNIFQFIPSFP